MKGSAYAGWRVLPRVLVPAALLLPTVLLVGAPASASTVTSAVFTGDSKTVTSGGVLYAKKDAVVTLTVSTSSDTKCVDVAGAITGHSTSSSGKTSWTFTGAKQGGGDGAQAVTATASPAVSGNSCTGTTGSAQAAYVLDNTGPVTVHFTCTDTLSGVAVCPDDVTLTANGAANSVTRTTADKAGNSASVTVGGIAIDQDKPVLTTADVTVQNGIYQLGAVPAPACTARDATAGIASCVVTLGAGTVGQLGWSATATDKAGNVSTASGYYRVVYRFDGFVQPINDTARQAGPISTFRAATTVPVRFQLKKANGTVVQATGAPAWLAPVKGSATCAVVNETVSTATPDTGSTYRYDSAAQQYAYNWKAGAAGNLWRLGVTLNDGQTYTVTIGLH